MLRSTLSHLTLVPESHPAFAEKGSAETLWARLRREAEEGVAKCLSEKMLNRLSLL